MIRSIAVIAALGAAGLALAACEARVTAPTDPGVCWHVGFPDGPDGPPKFNRVAEDQPNLEACAARLEILRRQFLRLGGNRDELIGAYQGQFLFVDNRKISTSESLTGGRYVLLVNVGGRLVVPGAVQVAPAPQGSPAPATPVN